MGNATVFYLTTILVYAAVDGIVCLGLSQQFGVAGVTNFGFIIFQAAGAYVAAILSLPSDTANGGFQTYIGGLNLGFPWPLIGATVAGAVLALPFVFLVGKRIRGDFAAVGLLIAAVIANLLVQNYVPLFNGDAGLSVVPSPFQRSFNPQSTGYGWGYAIASLVLLAFVYVFVRRITESPYGRSLRAMRDNDVVAGSIGKNLMAQRAVMLVVGGAIAGLSGGILVGFINLWAPSAWTYPETIVLFAAVIIGGAGNHLGAIIGAIVVPVGFEEATRYLPAVPGQPGLIPALEWVAIGLLIVGFLWFRPQGILPERRRVIGSAPVRLPSSPGLEATDGSALATRLSRPDGADLLLKLAEHRRIGTSEAVTRVGETEQKIALASVELSREFEGVTAVDRVTISVERGRLTGLIGPNGAGKSTLLALLAGTLAPTSGKVLLDGKDVTHLPAYRRARLGLIRTFQLASEFKRLTVMENLLSAVPDHSGDSFHGAILGRRFWRRDEASAVGRCEEMLDAFGLSQYANQYAGDLSGGQRRLVEIMRALIGEPDVLLLDEPMAGLHPRLARQLGNSLVALCGHGMTIFMVEHELAIMDEFCDPVIVMAEGRVLAEGTMATLRSETAVVDAYLVS
ncbi:MAG: ATP-binding cassette domain-containing protein [Acidimicrobiales bacterium]